MSYNATCLLDSRSACGVRLTTMVLTYPRFVHSELLTHRAFSRSSASSRAIPLAKMLKQVEEDPVIPIRWGSEAKGMQQGAELGAQGAFECKVKWLNARDDAVRSARLLGERGLHKSLCNRVVEPWMWITVIVTATDWQNFFRQRCHSDAEPHVARIAYMAEELYDDESFIKDVPEGSWHLPYVTNVDEWKLEEELLAAVGSGELHMPMAQVGSDGTPGNQKTAWLCAISAARVARVSYLTHDGARDWRKDLELADKLRKGSGFGHWAPTEHVAQSLSHEKIYTADDVDHQSRGVKIRVPTSGNFRGWRQYRKTFTNECAPE